LTSFLPYGVRHGIPADMSIIIFQILCYPTQKNVTQWKVHNLFTVLITYIGVIAKHLRRKLKNKDLIHNYADQQNYTAYLTATLNSCAAKRLTQAAASYLSAMGAGCS